MGSKLADFMSRHHTVSEGDRGKASRHRAGCLPSRSPLRQLAPGCLVVRSDQNGGPPAQVILRNQPRKRGLASSRCPPCRPLPTMSNNLRAQSFKHLVGVRAPLKGNLAEGMVSRWKPIRKRRTATSFPPEALRRRRRPWKILCYLPRPENHRYQRVDRRRRGPFASCSSLTPSASWPMIAIRG